MTRDPVATAQASGAAIERRRWDGRLLAGAAISAVAFLALLPAGEPTAADRALESTLGQLPARGTWEQMFSWPGDWITGVLVALAGLVVRGWHAVPWLAAAWAWRAVAQALKEIVGRARPTDALESLAFPSGHASSAAVLLPVAAALLLDPAPRRVRLAGWALVVFLVLLTGAGRVLGGVHWLTDVLAGWAFGAAGAMLILALRQRCDPVSTGRFDRHADGPLADGRRVKAIGVTGMPGSGKSEAMQVARDRGYPVVRMGDLVWEEVARRGLPRNAEHVGRVAHDMREEHGKDVWSLRTVERVRELSHGAPVVLIDGVRNNEEVQTFRQELGEDFVLVAIHTDPEHRHERMVARGRADDSLNVQVLKERDQRELGWGIARTIAMADEMVVNDADLEAFRARFAALLDELVA